MSRLTLLNRVTRHPSHHVIEEIDEYHARAGMTVVNFLYYANFRRFWNHARYLETLQKSDFLLPDGIALRLFIVRLESGSFLSFLQDRKKSLRDISNLNGTDFIPNFLSAIHTQRTRETLVFLYGGQE
jgi:UDP-N-acetyl-D-mannosaminuronic acid transferase (WecB/TagA/CpsF family)